MWVIKNKKYGNYYKSSINKDLKHFVSYIEEAKKMNKTQAKKTISTFNNINNFELVEVKK